MLFIDRVIEYLSAMDFILTFLMVNALWWCLDFNLIMPDCAKAREQDFEVIFARL